MTTDAYKKQAAAEAIKLVEPGMKLGLGTGSTAAHFIDLLGARVASGLDVVCVPTSEATRAHAQRLGIRLTTLDDEPYLDLTVDGADELDASLRLIKGGGGALLREKIVATASGRMVVIADDSKLVDALGRYPLPIETVEFGATSTRLLIEALAADAGCFGELSLRRAPDGRPFKSDSGNVIFDCAFNHISDPEGLAALLEMIPGVVEHGLFIDIADKAIVAGPRGVQVIDSSNDSE